MNNYANSRWKERGSFSKDTLHSYQDIIDAIRTAPYGFDTREAMAQMLMFLYGTVQSIGDSFSIDMSPTDTFENVAKLKEKYPNGQQGVFVVQDTGHWYFWSELENTWKDGGIYQSAGINFSNTPANKIGGYVVPLSTRSIGISYGSNQTITIDLPSKILYTKVKQNGKISLEGYATTQSTIDFTNGEYLIFDIPNLVFKNVTQGGLNALSNDYIILGYNSYGVFKGPWSNYVNSFKDLNYSKNLLIFPSKDLQISVDVSNNAAVYFNSKNLFYQKLDSNELGTYTVVDSKVVVPNNQYLVFDLNQKSLKVLTESQFVSDLNSSILCFYNYHGTIFGQWSIYYKSTDAELPGYYHASNYIDNKVDKINSNSSIASGVNFAYITDTHYGDNAGQSGNLLKYIKENTAISTVVFGGDIVRAYGTKANAWDDVKKYTNLVDDIGIVYGTKGNHDITIKASASETTGWTAPQSTIYDILNRRNERLIDNGINNKSYYYFDNGIQKVRFIVLDQYEDVQSGETTYWGTNSKFSQEQLDWLINDALNVDGYTLVVFTHSPSDSSMQYYSPYLDVVQKLLVAINNKQHFTYNQNGLTADVDFSKTTNTIACHLSGHAHIDETHVDNNVLSIGVLCDAAYNDDPQYKDKPRTKGTINEQAFDIVSLDTTNRTIKLVRIGQGNDREFNY
ncbi:metallophosphoesterase [Ligilactobacillus salivarius]|uniref:metallophosphoesterase family protein n=1 Tax=Ligilactobacillus salivarius TaxID=1624 RepID=UPI0025A46841|nr:metallophosphoesterase [Ligilactobacillus salivarius]MDM8223204.1 metallophosphoesterase [Ligilactobacillus salivarius]